MNEAMNTAIRTLSHVAWDWNGTLLDDLDISIEIINELLTEHAIAPVNKTRYLDAFDFPVINYYRTLGFDFDRVSFEIVGAEFIKRYEARRTRAQLQEGARETLATLRARGYSQSVLSAYRQDTLESLLTHFGIRSFFDEVVGSDNVYAHGKMEQGRAWMASRNIDPSAVLLVGDTRHDFEVARAMNCRCLLVADGHHPRSKLETLGAPVVDTLREVVDWIERHNRRTR